MAAIPEMGIETGARGTEGCVSAPPLHSQRFPLFLLSSSSQEEKTNVWLGSSRCGGEVKEEGASALALYKQTRRCPDAHAHARASVEAGRATGESEKRRESVLGRLVTVRKKTDKEKVNRD